MARPYRVWSIWKTLEGDLQSFKSHIPRWGGGGISILDPRSGTRNPSLGSTKQSPWRLSSAGHQEGLNGQPWGAGKSPAWRF